MIFVKLCAQALIALNFKSTKISTHNDIVFLMHMITNVSVVLTVRLTISYLRRENPLLSQGEYTLE